MKIFSFISSIVAFMLTAYFLISDFPDMSTLDGIIYFALFVILLAICVTGIIINRPLISRIHRRFRIADHSKH